MALQTANLDQAVEQWIRVGQVFTHTLQQAAG
jgi:hypothetical protein